MASPTLNKLLVFYYSHSFLILYLATFLFCTVQLNVRKTIQIGVLGTKIAISRKTGTTLKNQTGITGK